MQNGEHLNLEVNPSRRPVRWGKGLLDRVAHKIVGAPSIASEHDGKGAQMLSARDHVRSRSGALVILSVTCLQDRSRSDEKWSLINAVSPSDEDSKRIGIYAFMRRTAAD
jgi:hypothetical protein